MFFERGQAMVLSDRDIRRYMDEDRIVVRPRDDSCIQPASVDIHLDNVVRVFRHWQAPHYIDVRNSLEGLTELVHIKQGTNFSLAPQQFVLGSTEEHIEVPIDLMARLEGKSSLGRIGLLIHSTAGYIDPGWKGKLTLELYNVSSMPILLYGGMKISQISFHKLTSPAERPYGSRELGSKYQNQSGPTPTRFYLEFSTAELVSIPAVPRRRRDANPEGRRNNLREWLNSSDDFQGNIGQFARVLGVPQKTVEDWIYRDVIPSGKHRDRLFALTALSEFARRQSGGQAKLLG